MELPDLVTQTLGEESPVATVGLGGDDAVIVTPGRTLVYRSEGILSDESIEEYPHDVERVDLSEGRRKTTFALEYLDDTREFTVPSGATERVLKPLLAGVLRNRGVLDDGESVADVYRFSELTLVVAESRLLKHIGGAVWDDEFEEYRYDDVTGFAIEEGNVATQLVIEVDGRPNRIKMPNESASKVRRTVEQALFSYRDVSSAAELAAEASDEDDDAAADTQSGSGTAGAGDAQSDAGNGVAGDYDFGSLVDDDEDVRAVVTTDDEDDGGDAVAVGEELAALRETVERQNELLERQQQTIEQLIDELRRGR
ncbi:MAG: hypothetical protein ABEJ06_04730 [Haloarculaceae archaeon]